MGALRRSGFTLIEIVVVIAILAMVVVLSYEALSTYAGYQQFRGSTAELLSRLREARQRTVASETTGNFRVTITSSSTIQISDSAASSSEQYSFSGIRMTPALTSGTTSITFARLTGTPNATGTILLLHERTGATTTISVGDSGIITTQ